MGTSRTRRTMLIWLFNAAALLGLPPTHVLRRIAAPVHGAEQEAIMKLPPPRTAGTVSVEQAVHQRRTVRSFSAHPLTLDALSQLLWAAQGITGSRGFKRAAPSAGALYPMDVYAVAGEAGIDSVGAGVYRYAPEGHALSLVARGDLRKAVAEAALSQMWMARAPLSIVITAEYERSRVKYGNRSVRYAMIEAGHIGQNLFLQAEALDLKAGIVGAFHDQELMRVMEIPRAHEPLLIMPVGYGSRG